MHTDTRVERPSEDVLALIDQRRHQDLQRNDATSSYPARHRHRPSPAAVDAARSRVPDYLPAHERTELIPAVKVVEFKAVVPLPPRPAVPMEAPAAAVSAPVIVPTAPVTDDLLVRVLRGLRALWRKP